MTLSISPSVIMADEEAVPDDVLDQRKTFHEERRRGIFSTDTSAILGLSRYGTPLTVYRAKLGETDVRQPSLAAWLGSHLENLVAELYTTSTGIKVRADNLAHFHKTYPWLGTHLDRRAVGDPGLIIELKTRGSTRGWGEDGSSDVPIDVWTQVQHEAFVVGAREVHVAALFSNSSFRVYTIAPDPSFERDVVPVLSAFWQDNVVAKVPPLPTGADPDTEYVRALADEGDGGEMKPCTPEMEEIVLRYKLARFNAAQAEFARDGLKNELIQIIGPDSDGLTGTFGRILYKRTRMVRKTDWKLVAESLRRAAEELLELAAPSEDDLPKYAAVQAVVDAVEDLYTTTKPGSRRFTVDFVES